MKISLIILKFLFVGALFIVSNQNLHLGVPIERNIFFHDFYSWLETLFDHFSQISGYVVESHWLPNTTNSSLHN